MKVAANDHGLAEIDSLINTSINALLSHGSASMAYNRSTLKAMFSRLIQRSKTASNSPSFKLAWSDDELADHVLALIDGEILLIESHSLNLITANSHNIETT